MEQAVDEKYVRRRFMRDLASLRAECPVSGGLKVRVRRSSKDIGQSGTCGQSQPGGPIDITVHTVCLGTPESLSEQLETLRHEWAHAMALRLYGPLEGNAHDAVWGVCYAEAYRATVED